MITQRAGSFPLGVLCYVAPSKIVGAGNGLFALKKLEKNTRITWYEGEFIDRQTALSLSDTSYLRSASYGVIIDGFREPKIGAGAASFANHAPACDSNAKLVNLFCKTTHEETPVLLATKEIDEGEEILYNYGRDYWVRQEEECGSAPSAPSDPPVGDPYFGPCFAPCPEPPLIYAPLSKKMPAANPSALLLSILDPPEVPRYLLTRYMVEILMKRHEAIGTVAIFFNEDMLDEVGENDEEMKGSQNTEPAEEVFITLSSLNNRLRSLGATSSVSVMELIF